MAEARTKTKLAHEAAASRPAMEARNVAKLTRTARGAVIAVVLALLWAAPVAAAQPTRVVNRDLHPFVYPAGTACAFDVEGQPSSGFSAATTFGDGREMHSVHAKGAYVNMATGARFETRDIFTEIDRFDPATGILVGVNNGETTIFFLPSDRSPFGVGSNGALYHFVGTVHYTYDTNTNVFSVLAYSGTVTDVCAALS
jgi:hypothetical protein